MTDFQVSGNQLNPVAQVGGGNRLIAAFSADFTGANNTVTVDTGFQVASQQFQAITLFFDNSANANPVLAQVGITQHIFTIPPRSIGYYPLDAASGSKIVLSSVGGASALARANLYNYFIPAEVWYATGAAGATTAATIADGADVAEGAKADAAAANPAAVSSVIGILKGMWNTLIAGFSSGPYPNGATPLSARTTAAAGAAAATLVAGATRAYVTGFEVKGLGATAGSVIAVTLAGLLGGTRTYDVTVPAGVGVALTPLIVNFTSPIPASAAAVDIVLTSPSFGAGNTRAEVAIEGYTV